MRGTEDDPVTLPGKIGGYTWLPAVTTLQMVSTATWLCVRGHNACELQTDTAGFLHVSSGDERAVFRLDGTDA
jgi:hypothetical protein